jgi:hypothetical protein
MSATCFPPVARNLRAGSPGPRGVAVVLGAHLPRRNVDEGWHLRAARYYLSSRPAARMSEVIHGAWCRPGYWAVWRSIRRGIGGPPSL